MCFRGRVIQDQGNDLRSPIMCFDFGAPKNIGRIHQLFLFKIRRS